MFAMSCMSVSVIAVACLLGAGIAGGAAIAIWWEDESWFRERSRR